MSNYIRNLVAKKLLRSIDGEISSVLRQMSLNYDDYNGVFMYHFPLKTKRYDITSKTDSLITEKIEDDLVKKVNVVNKNNEYNIMIDMDRDSFIKKILESNRDKISPPSMVCNNNNIVIDFSSPNIAKPFHVGHLRSTIIGNYIANLTEYLNNNVTRLNYLGDWGTQFGLVKVGVDLINITDEQMKQDPINQLYHAYVHANKLSQTDPKILEQANKIFQQMENGDVNILNQWETFKKYTIDELEKIYSRIGIKFDVYNSESQYSAEKIKDLINYMKELKLLQKDVASRKVIALENIGNICMLKSDGSTLYLTREIAAAIDRLEKYNFDKMYYIVGASQQDHFYKLSKILSKMQMPWVDRLKHVQFGNIHGMSTRKGEVIFLTDILDEAREAAKERQNQSQTTKVESDDSDRSSEIIGLSAIIVNDLKQRRIRSYKFNWDMALNIKGETGSRLQYTHCRLSNLEENCGVKLPSECDPSLLKEPIVNKLVAIISQFDEAVVLSYQTLEACHLLKYLFQLSHSVNKAFETLRVKTEPEDVASQRLLLFHVAKGILNTGMKLVGLIPLKKM